MQTVSSLIRLACSAAFLTVAGTQPAYADPKITAVATAIQLQDGQTSGPVSLLFRVDGLKKEPKVRVFSTSLGGPGLATLGRPTMVAELTNGAFWQVPVFVSGLPLNSSFDALLVVQVDDTISESCRIHSTTSYPRWTQTSVPAATQSFCKGPARQTSP